MDLRLNEMSWISQCRGLRLAPRQSLGVQPCVALKAAIERGQGAKTNVKRDA